MPTEYYAGEKRTMMVGATSLDDLTAEPLALEHMRPAYPLVQQANPKVTLSSWLAFARPLTGGRISRTRGCIIVHRRGSHLPNGMFCYWREPDLANRIALRAEHFIAVDVLTPVPVMMALLSELEGVSRRLGCRVVRSLVHNGSATVSRALVDAGHQPTGVLLTKELVFIDGDPGLD